jgi:hypothetical protein
VFRMTKGPPLLRTAGPRALGKIRQVSLKNYLMGDLSYYRVKLLSNTEVVDLFGRDGLSGLIAYPVDCAWIWPVDCSWIPELALSSAPLTRMALQELRFCDLAHCLASPPEVHVGLTISSPQ